MSDTERTPEVADSLESPERSGTECPLDSARVKRLFFSQGDSVAPRRREPSEGDAVSLMEAGGDFDSVEALSTPPEAVNAVAESSCGDGAEGASMDCPFGPLPAPGPVAPSVGGRSSGPRSVSRRGRLGRYLANDVDARLKLLAALVLGMLGLHAGPVGVGVSLAVLVALLLGLRPLWPSRAGVCWSYGLFVLFWSGVKWGVDVLLAGLDWRQAGLDAAGLGLRLSVLVLVGLVLGLAASSRQLGLAVGWVLRPVLRDRAWKFGVAMALMIHDLLGVWQAVHDTGRALRSRGLHLPPGAAVGLRVRSTVRRLGQRVWKQALAVVARSLDNPVAWRPAFAGSVAQRGIGLVLIGALAALAWI